MNRYLLRESILVIAFLVGLLGTAAAQDQPPELINDSKFRPVAQAAVDSVYNFNFDGANELLSPWKNKYPDHPLWMLIDAMELWWQVLSDLENTSHDEEFFHRMKRTDYEASQLLRKNSSHADGLIIKIVSNGYIARQYSNRDEWLKSINRARKALSSHDYLLELQPDLPDLKLAKGLKMYYSAYLPEAYPIVRTVSWFLPEGNKEKGLEHMEEAAENAIFARAEAAYFLGNINYNYQNDYDKATSYFKQLYNKYPNNNYYVRKYVSSLYRMKRYDRALQIIDESLTRWKQKKLPHEEVLKEELLTWKGRILYLRDNSRQAIVSFKQAFDAGYNLPQTRHRSFHVAAGYYLGKLLYEEADYIEARKYLQEVSDSKTGEGFQEQAKRLLESMPAD